MAQYRKKPVVISAEQFMPDVLPWPEGVEKVEPSKSFPTGFKLITLENPIGFCVTAADWIITGVKGERYACKPDIFDETYDAVTE